MKRRESFTLLEILVVLVIITVLSGLVFKLMQMTRRVADKAQTIAKLEKIAHALEDFRAEYGQFPPVVKDVCSEHGNCSFCYVHEDTNRMNKWLAQDYIQQNPADTNCNQLFKFGVMAYLLERYDESHPGGISPQHFNCVYWIDDTSRDEAAKRRWAHFLDGIVSTMESTNRRLIESQPFSNSFVTVYDAWDHVLKYSSEPPYLHYDLWSVGPDGVSGTADDLHNKKWDN